MKKYLLPLALLSALSLSLSAAADEQAKPDWQPGEQHWQDGAHGWHHGGHHGGRHENIIEHLAKELDLSTDQKAQAAAIFTAQKEKFKALHEESEKNFTALLSADQLAKFEQMKKERMDKWHKRRAATEQTSTPPAK